MYIIRSIRAREILNSRGEWTIETTVELPSGYLGMASVSEGKSIGSDEAVPIDSFDAVGVINEKLSEQITNKEFSGLKELDEILKELDGTENKSNLGANTILSISIASAKAFAAEENIHLWDFVKNELGEDYYISQSPSLFANLINGGLHSGSGLAFQEFLVISTGRDLKEEISFMAEIYNELGVKLEELFGSMAINIGDEGGFSPPCEDEAAPFEIMEEVLKDFGVDDMLLGLDAAGENIEEDDGEMLEIYESMIDKFGLSYVEDPFGENNYKYFSELLERVEKKCIIAGDDLTTTNVERMDKAREENSVNGVIIKPNQIGTLSETFEAIRFARENNWQVVVSHRSGETNDDFIADLAYGTGADGIKLGAPARGERVAKYNRLLEIIDEV